MARKAKEKLHLQKKKKRGWQNETYRVEKRPETTEQGRNNVQVTIDTVRMRWCFRGHHPHCPCNYILELNRESSLTSTGTHLMAVPQGSSLLCTEVLTGEI